MCSLKKKKVKKKRCSISKRGRLLLTPRKRVESSTHPVMLLWAVYANFIRSVHKVAPTAVYYIFFFFLHIIRILCIITIKSHSNSWVVTYAPHPLSEPNRSGSRILTNFFYSPICPRSGNKIDLIRGLSTPIINFPGSARPGGKLRLLLMSNAVLTNRILFTLYLLSLLIIVIHVNRCSVDNQKTLCSLLSRVSRWYP